MISSQRVTEIFMDALFQENELNASRTGPKDGLEVAFAPGVITNIGFNKERLETHREEVKGFLADLSLKFRSDEGLDGAGGGFTFLNVCEQADGEQWTGSHQICEQLMQLGTGLGYVTKLPMPAQFLPGHVPYFAVNLSI